MFQLRDEQIIEASPDVAPSGATGRESGKLDAVFDESKNLMRVTGRGIWSPDYLDRHFIECDAILRSARERARPVNVMVDLGDAPVQPAETAARLMEWTRKTYQPDDRVAVVVSSCLVKMQMRRAVESNAIQVFVSMAAAEMWLFAWEQSCLPASARA